MPCKVKAYICLSGRRGRESIAQVTKALISTLQQPAGGRRDAGFVVEVTDTHTHTHMNDTTPVPCHQAVQRHSAKAATLDLPNRTQHYRATGTG